MHPDMNIEGVAKETWRRLSKIVIEKVDWTKYTYKPEDLMRIKRLSGLLVRGFNANLMLT